MANLSCPRSIGSPAAVRAVVKVNLWRSVVDVGGHVRVERKGAALVLSCVAQFVDVLDVNAVIVALPSIGQDLGFSQAGLQWVISAHVLFFAGFLLLSGTVADLRGRRRIFVAGLAVFTVASLCCGPSVSPEMLVVSRAIHGLGAASTAPAALSIITTIFAEGREGDRAVATWTAVTAGVGLRDCSWADSSPIREFKNTQSPGLRFRALLTEGSDP